MEAAARIVIKAGREKSLRRRHPWIFSGAVEKVEGAAGAGDTVDVVDAAGEFLARAAYSPASQIRARVWTFDPAETVDEAFFRRAIARAADLRRRLGRLDPDGACRVVFSESDGLPGVIADHYAGHVVCQFVSAGAERWRDTITAALVAELAPRAVHERSEGAGRRKEGLPSRRGLLAGEASAGAVEYRAGALRRLVRIGSGQKTGAYLDQQDNVQRVARYARGARVLDAFAYTGGFAIAALAEGAASATLIDGSGEALEAAAEEAALNGVAERCRCIEADVFEELRALGKRGERFGLVVLDPPKFVHSASQIQAGSRGYKDVNLSALRLVAPGGVLATFSCSGHVDAALFQKIVAGAAVDAGRRVRILERLGHPPDHPIALEFPEAEYLTGLVLHVQ
ncbi:MAG TPA: class I SAM-dependent methyltransferase [Gammaproteobacteria bacterium]